MWQLTVHSSYLSWLLYSRQLQDKLAKWPLEYGFPSALPVLYLTWCCFLSKQLHVCKAVKMSLSRKWIRRRWSSQSRVILVHFFLQQFATRTILRWSWPQSIVVRLCHSIDKDTLGSVVSCKESQPCLTFELRRRIRAVLCLRKDESKCSGLKQMNSHNRGTLHF